MPREPAVVRKRDDLFLRLPTAGVSVLYAVLLFLSRRAILDGKPTSLSKALSFLVRSAAHALPRTPCTDNALTKSESAP